MQEKYVANDYNLNKTAKDAYRAYIAAYNSHSLKDIFNVHRLDLQVLFTRINHCSCNITLWVFMYFFVMVVVTGGCSIVLFLIAAKSESEHRKWSWEGEEG